MFSNFISKPWQQAQLRIVLDNVVRDLDAKQKIQETQHELELVRNEAEFYRDKLEKNTRGAVTLLRQILQNSSPKLSNHCRRTAIIATNVARRLQFDAASIQKLESAALIHDISLSVGPDHLQGAVEMYLSKSDQVVYRSHPEEVCGYVAKYGRFRGRGGYYSPP